MKPRNRSEVQGNPRKKEEKEEKKKNAAIWGYIRL
jgi:hypothetical protein